MLNCYFVARWLVLVLAFVLAFAFALALALTDIGIGIDAGAGARRRRFVHAPLTLAFVASSCNFSPTPKVITAGPTIRPLAGLCNK